MLAHHLVRVGLLGHVGRFRATDARRYPRGLRVVVRTARGLEVGEVLAAPTPHPEPQAAVAGSPSPTVSMGATITMGANVTIGRNAQIAEPSSAEAAERDADYGTSALALESATDDGTILRGMTVEDELLDARLQRHRDRAFEACQQRLAERNINAALIDVEHLFDGHGLYFYFLGQPPQEADELTSELAETYDAHVEFRQFADTLTHGCGPDCGTESATGGGCGSCGTGCAIASACRPKSTTVAEAH